MQAVILAGGLGTRLRGVVDDRPKPMADVCGRPFLEILLNDLKSAGVTDIIFAVGYLGELIEDYFGDGSVFDVNIHYSWEKEQLGTAGAIKNALAYITDERVLVLNGDTYYKMDYRAVFNSAVADDTDMTIVLRKVQDVSRYGKVTLDDKKIVRFNEKSNDTSNTLQPGQSVPGLINGGVYVMRKSLIETIPHGKVSIENESIPQWIAEGKLIEGYVHDGYFIDIGIPEDYYEFVEDWKAGNLHS